MRAVLGGIVELERRDAPVDEVGAVDAGEALGEHRADAEVQRREHRRLARGALAVVLAPHDDAHARRLRALDERGIDVPEAELRDGGHVGAEHEALGAGRRDVVRRDLVAEHDQDRRGQALGQGCPRGTSLMFGPLITRALAASAAGAGGTRPAIDAASDAG